MTPSPSFDPLRLSAPGLILLLPLPPLLGSPAEAERMRGGGLVSSVESAWEGMWSHMSALGRTSGIEGAWS